MIEIQMLRSKDGDVKFAPVFICDVCDKQIENDGNCLFSEPTDDSFCEYVTVHKGQCTQVHDAMTGEHSLWMNLSVLVVHLLNNIHVKYSYAKMWADFSNEVM